MLAKVIPFPIERVRAKALQLGESSHAANFGIGAELSSCGRASARLRSSKRSAARGVAAHLFTEAVEQSEMKQVEVAACLDIDRRVAAKICDGELPLEVGHVLLLPSAARERVLKMLLEEHERLKARGR